MPRQIVATREFLRAYHRLTDAPRDLVDASLQRFRDALQGGSMSAGLGHKHLGGRTHEFRAGLALRVVYVAVEDQIILTLLGTHDDVRRFLKR